MNGKYLKTSLGFSNTYLIKGKDGYLLIDSGVKNKTDKLRDKMSEYGIKFSDIILIIITHVHSDHVGGLKEIKDKTKAPVLVHKSEAELLKKGESTFPKGNNLIGKMIVNFMNRRENNTFNPVKPDISIRDYYNLKGFGFEGEVIHTPGHTKGSISIIIEDRHCFIGDTMFSYIPFSCNPPFADYPKKLYQSWEKIKKYDCQIFHPGHGYEFHRNKFIRTFKRKRNT